jgi:hypothetical protein
VSIFLKSFNNQRVVLRFPFGTEIALQIPNHREAESHGFQSLETNGLMRREKCADLLEQRRKGDIEGF